jgi:hypothetical protein
VIVKVTENDIRALLDKQTDQELRHLMVNHVAWQGQLRGSLPKARMIDCIIGMEREQSDLRLSMMKSIRGEAALAQLSSEDQDALIEMVGEYIADLSFKDRLWQMLDSMDLDEMKEWLSDETDHSA